MLRFLTLEQVTVAPNRQRAFIDPVKLQELANSIRDNHLIHAPVVDGSNTLIVGERRYRAIQLLHDMGEEFYYGQKKVPPGFVPVVDIGDLTDIQRYEIELEENIRREGLTWQEEVQATARLAELKTSIALAAGLTPPSNAQLEGEIRGLSKASDGGTVREHLDLARNMDKPEVAKAKTQKEATKALKRIVQAEQHAKLAAAVGATASASRHILHRANCLEFMPGYQSESFDCICTDPPYGMGADQFGDSGGSLGRTHGYADDVDVLDQILSEAPREFWRVLKPQGHVYVFCDFRFFGDWKSALECQGFRVFRTPLIWHKPTGLARAPWPEIGPQRRYECIVYAIKGNKPVTGMYSDVISVEWDEATGHAAQKPVALYTNLLRRSCLPGETVLDPFCGSGPIFPAAEELKLTAHGIEMDEVSYGIAAQRLAALKA